MRGSNAILLDQKEFTRFCVDLIDVWIKHGYHDGLTISPFYEMINFFLTGRNELPCAWRDNCANAFVSLDPRGHVGLCDCWVATYPEFRFGNIMDCENFEDLMVSPPRLQFLRRPADLAREGQCLDCDHLGLCHGGCPMRAYTSFGSLAKTDPYCETYKTILGYTKDMAISVSRLGMSDH